MAWRVLFYALFIVSAIIGNYVTFSIAALMFLVRYITQDIILTKSAKILGEQKFKAKVLLLDVLIPLINLFVSIRIGLSGGTTYKW